MKIAIDTRHLHTVSTSEYGNYLYGLLSHFTSAYPNEEFIFLFDRPYSAQLIFDQNVKAVVRGPATVNSFLLRYWYDVSLPPLLRQLGADLFVTGPGTCSLWSAIPQCMFITGLHSYQQAAGPVAKVQQFLAKKLFAKCLQKAAMIIATSESLGDKTARSFPVVANKLRVIEGSVATSRSMTDTEKADVRQKHTGSKYYFISSGWKNDGTVAVNLLKAFSIFKKRQKSDWKLVLMPGPGRQHRDLYARLSSYKYRDDVILVSGIGQAEMHNLIAAAYAFILPSGYVETAWPVLAPLSCDVPLIAAQGDATGEFAADAALFINSEDPADIADKLMLVYKDESLRNKLVEKGRMTAARYSWSRATQQLWRALEKLSTTNSA